MRHRSDITATIHPFPSAGNLKAYADVTFRSRVGEITIRRFKIIASDTGKLWVALPQYEYESFLKTNYVDAIVISKRVLQRVQRVALNAYATRMREETSRDQVDHS